MEDVHLRRIGGVPLPVVRGEEHACPYLPGRVAQEEYLLTMEVPAAFYQRLLVHRFRRSGNFFYRPVCRGCRACQPIRVPVSEFVPSRSQRRVLRRNADVRIELGPPRADDEHVALYQRYQQAVHGHDQHAGAGDYVGFLVDSPLDTFEVRLRLGRRLIGVSVVDPCGDGLSSVYFYYDPDEAGRSLGVFSGLVELDVCRRRGVPYWYLGFHIAGCAKMEYKARFRPFELLGPGGRWRRGESAASSAPPA